MTGDALSVHIVPKRPLAYRVLAIALRGSVSVTARDLAVSMAVPADITRRNACGAPGAAKARIRYRVVPYGIAVSAIRNALIPNKGTSRAEERTSTRGREHRRVHVDSLERVVE
jgi:hypothetical protein